MGIPAEAGTKGISFRFEGKKCSCFRRNSQPSLSAQLIQESFCKQFFNEILSLISLAFIDYFQTVLTNNKFLISTTIVLLIFPTLRIPTFYSEAPLFLVSKLLLFFFSNRPLIFLSTANRPLINLINRFLHTKFSNHELKSLFFT